MTERRSYYVGLAATLHDPALAIVGPDGRVLFAEAGERYLQNKRAYNCAPDHIVRARELIEEHCGSDPEINLAIGWSRSLLHRLRLAATGEMPPWSWILGPFIRRALRQRDHLVWPYGSYRSLAHSLMNNLGQAGVNLRWTGIAADFPPRYYDHHLAHAALACLGGPYEESACAIVDGFGEWTSTSCYRFESGRLTPLLRQGAWKSGRRGSLGMFYATLCALCGFDSIKGEEWKVMGLAPYGKADPALVELLRGLLRVDGLEILQACSHPEYLARLEALREAAPPPGSPPLAAADLARSGQEVFGEIMARLLRNLRRALPSGNLALAGGCALNSSWNGRLLRETGFRSLYVPSAPADDGTAVGAALLAFQEDHPEHRSSGEPLTPYLGSAISTATLERFVRSSGLEGVIRLPLADLAGRVAEALADGKIVGWVQGRAEFGPRALGNRSILADPRRLDMKARINAGVKFREDFRPFAPVILHQHGPAYFDDYQESPYMERTMVFRPDVRSKVPAVVHVDGTGRAQSVRAERNERFHAVLEAFRRLTGVPVLLNTSFNVMGRPIVHSVEDAVGAFLTTELDVLVLGDYYVEKPGRPPDRSQGESGEAAASVRGLPG